MDIEEIRLARIELEKSISQLLDDFERTCRISISQVTVDSVHNSLSMILDSRHTVTVRIEL